MPFLPPPARAAWTHQDARSGFEVVFVDATDDGVVLVGCTTAVEDGRPWIVEYEIRVDAAWRARRARVSGRSGPASRTVLLDADGDGSWWVDGRPAPQLAGCLDVDLESSAVTNALPVHRLALATGETAEAPAAYVRALDLTVDVLGQRYTRVSDVDGHQCYDYRAPAFDFSCRLVYDDSGFVLTYPGIAVRVA